MARSYRVRYAEYMMDRARRLAESPAAVAERLRYQRARAQMEQERDARYPLIDGTNAREVLDWQEARIRELLAQKVV